MNIFHLADTHVGFAAYRKTTREGVNQREQDTFDAFKQIIDKAVEQKPDVVLHAGDLFDTIRPSNRSISFALEQLHHLSKNNIPFVVIAGNHEQPRLKETGHIFKVFEHIDNVYPVYKNSYEKITINTIHGMLAIHAVPQCSSNDVFEKELEKIKLDKQATFNIFMAHGSLKSIKELRMNEFNELFIPDSIFQKDFDYIALGHYHKHTKIKKNAYYAGSSERFTFSDAGDNKGFCMVTLGKETKQQFIPLSIRPMLDIPPILCDTKNTQEVMKEIISALEKIDHNNAVIRIQLKDIKQHVYRSFDFSEIRRYHQDAVHCEIVLSKSPSLHGSSRQTSSQIGTLVQEFNEFVDQHTSLKNKQQIRELGMKYIQKNEGHESK